MQRNTIRLDATPIPRELTLVSQGTVWPIAIEVDGETWERTDEFETVGSGETVRVYKYAQFPKRRSG